MVRDHGAERVEHGSRVREEEGHLVGLADGEILREGRVALVLRAPVAQQRPG